MEVKRDRAPPSRPHGSDGRGLMSGWVVMEGFPEEVTFEPSLKDLAKRKIKEWWWKMVTVFYVEERMCVQEWRCETLTFSRKYKWFPVTEAKALRRAQRCEAGVGGPFGGPGVVIGSEHNSGLCNTYLFIAIIYWWAT